MCAITSAAAFVSYRLFLFSLISVLTGLPVSTAGTSSSMLSKTRGKRARESPDRDDQDPGVTDVPADEPAGNSRNRARTELGGNLASYAALQGQPEAAAVGEVQASAGFTAASLGL